MAEDTSVEKVVKDAVTDHCCLHGVKMQTDVSNDAVGLVDDVVLPNAACTALDCGQQSGMMK